MYVYVGGHPCALMEVRGGSLGSCFAILNFILLRRYLSLTWSQAVSQEVPHRSGFTGALVAMLEAHN